MPSFPIIDTHVHLWDTELHTRPWLEAVPELKTPFMLEQFDAARGDTEIAGIVYVETDVAPGERLSETEWIAEVAETDARIKGIVAAAPIAAGEAIRLHLDKLREFPLVKGVRKLIQGHDEDYCLSPNFVEGVECLAEYGYTFDICIAHTQMRSAIDLVCQCPEITFVLDHLGKPDVRGGEIEPWEPQIQELARLDNCYCKISGLVTEADHKAWEKEDLRPYIEHVIQCFGMDRVLFGSDWPVETLAATYAEWIAALDDILCDVSEKDLQKLYCDNAKKVYRLED